MRNTLIINDRSLRSAFIERCHDEREDPVQVLEAWLRRALRQEGTVLPRSERSDNVTSMRGRR